MKNNPQRSVVIVSGGKTISIQKTTITSRSPVADGRNAVDLVFVFDTTGSMDTKIEALLKTCSQFVSEAAALGLDLNFALVSFGDISIQGSNDKIELAVELTSSLEKIKLGLSNIPRNNGYGNLGESCLEAIQEAFKIDHRKTAVKVLILITDEPALQQNITANEVTSILKQREYLVFVIATDEKYYKDMAVINGGSWTEITTNATLEKVLAIFRNMARKISSVASEVHRIGKGSVKKYLELNPPTGK